MTRTDGRPGGGVDMGAGTQRVRNLSERVAAQAKKNGLTFLQGHEHVASTHGRAARRVDSTDWAIVMELQNDCRISFSELGRRVHMSSPAVAERVRRLEESGVIIGYHAEVDLPAAGWPVLALVRLQCFGPRCILQHVDTVTAWPQVLELHRVTGEVCCELKVVAVSMTDFEAVVDRLAAFGQPASTLVLSSPLGRGHVRRPPP